MRAKGARIDVVLLQETHYYNDSYHRRMSGLLNGIVSTSLGAGECVGREMLVLTSIKSKGYKPYLSHANTEDISAGVAICIQADSRSVRIPEGKGERSH